MASKKVLFDVVPVSKREDSLPFWRFAVGVILVSDPGADKRDFLSLISQEFEEYK